MDSASECQQQERDESPDGIPNHTDRPRLQEIDRRMAKGERVPLMEGAPLPCPIRSSHNPQI